MFVLRCFISCAQPSSSVLVPKAAKRKKPLWLEVLELASVGAV